MKMNTKKIKTLQELTAKWYGIPKVKGSQKDYYTVYTDYCNNKGDYSETFKTKLYNKHSTEYCILLEVLNAYYKDHITDNKI